MRTGSQRRRWRRRPRLAGFAHCAGAACQQPGPVCTTAACLEHGVAGAAHACARQRCNRKQPWLPSKAGLTGARTAGGFRAARAGRVAAIDLGRAGSRATQPGSSGRRTPSHAHALLQAQRALHLRARLPGTMPHEQEAERLWLRPILAVIIGDGTPVGQRGECVERRAGLLRHQRSAGRLASQSAACCGACGGKAGARLMARSVPSRGCCRPRLRASKARMSNMQVARSHLCLQGLSGTAPACAWHDPGARCEAHCSARAQQW